MSQPAPPTGFEVVQKIRQLELRLALVERYADGAERARNLKQQIQALYDELASEEGA